MLRRKKGFKRPTRRIAKIAPRKLKAREEYSRVRKMYLLEKGYFCEICGKVASDIHHKSGRGKNLCAMNTFMAVCRPCHMQIHDNPQWAKENGYLVYEFK
jgi:hypothetical protein